MKKLALVGAALGLLMFGFQSKAEALTFSFHVCQGATCSDFASASASGTVGDYTFSALGAGLNGTPTSNSQTSTIAVSRLTFTSATALDVWLTIQGYTLPVSSAGYTFDVALGATETNAGATPGRDLITYQAWYNSANLAGPPFPPAGSVASLLASCTPANAGSSDSCFNDPGAVLATPGSSLYSVTSRTTFNIGQNNTETVGTTGTASLTAVPEPGSMLLLGTGLVGLGGLIRRRIVRK